MEFMDYIQANLLKPAGLKNTWSPAEAQDTAPIYQDSARPLPKDCLGVLGTGGLYATAEDLAAFGGALTGTKLLKQSSLDAMAAPEYARGIWPEEEAPEEPENPEIPEEAPPEDSETPDVPEEVPPEEDPPEDVTPPDATEEGPAPPDGAPPEDPVSPDGSEPPAPPPEDPVPPSGEEDHIPEQTTEDQAEAWSSLIFYTPTGSPVKYLRSRSKTWLAAADRTRSRPRPFPQESFWQTVPSAEARAM